MCVCILNTAYRSFDDSPKDYACSVIIHSLFTINCYLLLCLSSNVTRTHAGYLGCPGD